MTNVSLLKAFWILFNGSDYQIGEGYSWKRGILTLAIGLTAIFPIVNFWDSQFYSGAIPPEVSITKNIGTFKFGKFDSRSVIRKYNITFISENGAIYYLMDDAFSSDALTELKYKSSLNIEGFFLKNGNGFFWPTFISRPDGSTLLDRDRSSRILNDMRDPFGGKLILEYVLLLPLWLASLSNAIKLRKKLSKGF